VGVLLGVRVAVGVRVGVWVAVFVGVFVAVEVDVLVAVLVAVFVGVGGDGSQNDSASMIWGAPLPTGTYVTETCSRLYPPRK
jgi:hypothetical protein